MRYFLLFILAVMLTSCEKEDDKIILPPPGPVSQLVAPMGSLYNDQVYVNLDNGTTVVRPFNAYDLTFETVGGTHIYVNSGKLMFVCRTGQTDITLADTIGKPWYVEDEQYDDDSSAIPAVMNSEVFIIDRGKSLHNGQDRFRKLQLIYVNDQEYKIRYCLYDNSSLTEKIIPKDSLYSLMYFTFSNGGQLVDQAPPSASWDFVFTKYTHVYYEEPLNSPFRNYIVSGAVLNKWTGTTGAMMKKDSIPGYVPFEDADYSVASSYPFSVNADIIGFDWKYYDFNTNRYYIRPDLYFFIKDRNGVYYKMRMIDYYDTSGNKGTVTLEYQRI